MDGEYEDAFRRDVRQVGRYPEDLSTPSAAAPVVKAGYSRLTVHVILYRCWHWGQSYLNMGEVERRFVCRVGVMIASLEAAPARDSYVTGIYRLRARGRVVRPKVRRSSLQSRMVKRRGLTASL